jgi:glutathione S-transferase
MHAGRGEVARMALFMGNVAFEDDRVPFAAWAARKPTTPFGSMPVLEVDGNVVTQSNGINRFVGKLTGLYPSDAFQAALCDEAMDVVEDASTPVVATFNLPEDEKKARRAELAEGPLKLFLERLERRLVAEGGEWFGGGPLGVADLKVYLWIRHLRSGKIDYLPRDLPERYAPLLVAHHDRVKADPRVRAYELMRGLA